MASYEEIVEQIRRARQTIPESAVRRGILSAESPSIPPFDPSVLERPDDPRLDPRPGLLNEQVPQINAADIMDQKIPSAVQQFMDYARTQGSPMYDYDAQGNLVQVGNMPTMYNEQVPQMNAADIMDQKVTPSGTAVDAIRIGADAARTQKENQQTESLLGGIFDNPIVKQLVAGLAAPEFLASQYGLGGRSPVAALVGGMQANQAREVARTKEAAKLQEEMRRQAVKEAQEQQKIDILQQKADREPTGKPAARGKELRNILERSLINLRKQKAVDDIIEGKTEWRIKPGRTKPTEAELIPIILDKAQEEYIKNPNAGFDAAVLKALGKGAATAQSQKPAKFGQARIK